MPTPDEIRHFIKTIPEKVRTLSYNKVIELCNYYFPQIPIATVNFTNELFFFHQREWSGWNVIYRGRKINDKNDAPYSNISEISYIPIKESHNITSFGRANKKGEAMFYGSLNAATASIETLSRGGEFLNAGSAMLTMGVWKFEAPLKLAEVPYSEKYWKLLYDTVTFKSEKFNEIHIKKWNEELREQVNNDLMFEVLILFADAFAKFDIKNDSDYYLSNYYTDRIFKKLPGFGGEDVDGIIYPSVLNSYEESNIALKPEVVDTKLRCIEAMQVWAVHFMKTGGGAQFIPIQDKIFPTKEGKFSWRHSGT